MKALKELDEVITWLGRSGKLTGKNMEKAQKCLVAVSQEYDAMELRDFEQASSMAFTVYPEQRSNDFNDDIVLESRRMAEACLSLIHI